VRDAAAIVFLALLAGFSDAAEPPLLTWHEPDGSPRFALSSSALAGADRPGVELRAPIWNPRLPDLSIPLLDESHVALGGWKGSVLVLDFWASWCEPCRRELPLLEGLYRDLKGQGLQAIAVNVFEEPEIARDAARALGLTMPIGRFEEPMRPVLYRKALPTVIVADRFGSIRRRFDGFRVGDEVEIAKLVRELTAETAPPEETVAKVVGGEGTFRVVWSREPPTSVDGLTIVEGAESRGVLASLWRGITLFDAAGRTAHEWPSSRSRGELRAGSAGTALAFRPGSVDATLLSLIDGKVGAVAASAEILDASPFGSDAWVVATTHGVERLGSEPIQAEDRASIAAVAAADGAGAPRILALAKDGRLLSLDASLRSIGEARSTAPGSKLLGGAHADPGYAIVSDALTSGAVGRPFRGGGAGIALAIANRLLVVELAAGRVRFDAAWPDIRWIAMGDLDGDGIDEIAVASPRRIAVLTASGVGP
jgi:thiol-disulfide isomerase/thioredoxin